MITIFKVCPKQRNKCVCMYISEQIFLRDIRTFDYAFFMSSVNQLKQLEELPIRKYGKHWTNHFRYRQNTPMLPGMKCDCLSLRIASTIPRAHFSRGTTSKNLKSSRHLISHAHMWIHERRTCCTVPPGSRWDQFSRSRGKRRWARSCCKALSEWSPSATPPWNRGRQTLRHWTGLSSQLVTAKRSFGAERSPVSGAVTFAVITTDGADRDDLSLLGGDHLGKESLHCLEKLAIFGPHELWNRIDSL